MHNLETVLKNSAQKINDPNVQAPVFFQLRNIQEQEALSSLLEKKKDICIINSYDDQIKELLAVKNPSLLKNHEKLKKTFEVSKKSFQDGVWVYFPWRNALVHVLDKSDYKKLKVKIFKINYEEYQDSLN